MMLQRAIESKFLLMISEITGLNKGRPARRREGFRGFFGHVAVHFRQHMRYTWALR
jgi:hypothetical protein